MGICHPSHTIVFDYFKFSKLDYFQNTRELEMHYDLDKDNLTCCIHFCMICNAMTSKYSLTWGLCFLVRFIKLTQFPPLSMSLVFNLKKLQISLGSFRASRMQRYG